MPTQSAEKLQEKTVIELHEMASKQGVEGHSTMNKEELVDALSGKSQTKNMSTTTHKSEEKDEKPTSKEGPLNKTEEDVPGYQAPHGSPFAGITIKGEERTGKGETRLFQTNDPNVKEWMTEEQARKAGKYWKPAEPEPKDAVQATPKK
jgi:hypothetical protein